MVLIFAVDAEAGLVFARARVLMGVPQDTGGEMSQHAEMCLSPLAVSPTLHVPPMKWEMYVAPKGRGKLTKHQRGLCGATSASRG